MAEGAVFQNVGHAVPEQPVRRATGRTYYYTFAYLSAPAHFSPSA